MKCPKCKTNNPAKVKFCGTCGSNLFIACSECKTNNPVTVKFCGSCGARLVKGKVVRDEPVRPRPRAEEISTYSTVNTSDDDGTIRGILGGLFCLTLYFIPFGIALFRNKHNKLAIFALNLLLGWTFIGWVVALIWATTTRMESEKPVQEGVTDSSRNRYMSSIQDRAKGGPLQGCHLIPVGLVVLGIIIFVATRACGGDTPSNPQATSTPNQGYSGEPTVTPTPRAYATATGTPIPYVTPTAIPTPAPIIFSDEQASALLLKPNDFPNNWTAKKNGMILDAINDYFTDYNVQKILITLETHETEAAAQAAFSAKKAEAQTTIDGRGISGDELEDVKKYPLFVWNASSQANFAGVEKWTVIGVYGNITVKVYNEGSFGAPKKGFAVDIAKKQIDSIKGD